MADGAAGARPDYLERLELLRVRSSKGVVAETVRLSTEGEVTTLTFDIRTEPTVEAPTVDIRDVETVHFVYADGRRFGEAAPRNILCDRQDFPRNVGHLCSGPPGYPAVPCLALGGMQPIYERGGIEALMERLRTFMRDAKTGSLMADGWEPVPFGFGQKLRFGQVPPAFFQEYAHAHPDEDRAFGVTVLRTADPDLAVLLAPGAVAVDEMRAFLGARSENDKRLAVPWIFVWPGPAAVETDPIFEDWRTWDELRAGLDTIGLRQPLETALGELLTAECDFKHEHPEGRRSIVVVIGVRRPTPIMESFYGYSADAAARRLELRALIVSWKLSEPYPPADAEVRTIIGDHPPEPGLFRWVSGMPELPPVAVLGAGALGSAILNNLVRGGASDILVQDHDRLHAHNLARNTARFADGYSRKVAQARGLVSDIYGADNAVRCEIHDEDICAMPPNVLADRLKGWLVVDATADERVRLALDHPEARGHGSIIRSEMFHEGRLGVTFVSHPEGPGLSDLMVRLYVRAIDDPDVAAWLDLEDRFPLGPDPLLYGFGCTSQTTRLANSVVQLHAAAATAVVVRPDAKSGFGLNPVDDRGLPKGWSWHAVAPFRVLTPATAKDWTVRLDAEAAGRLQALREEVLPDETGGYLYGVWDPARKVITVVLASGRPPDTVADETTLRLGPAGATPEERRWLRKTRGRLYLCGTWHSHPKGSAAMSGRDYRTHQAHHVEDAPFLRPTLMLIVAEDDVQAHLKVS